jgi:hypothetical protein
MGGYGVVSVDRLKSCPLNVYSYPVKIVKGIKMTCEKCKYFKVLYEPLQTARRVYALGKAKCERHDLITEFDNHKKLKQLNACGYFEPQEEGEK